nr:hypothetical protein [Deltaproteobacteria bacterium]
MTPRIERAKMTRRGQPLTLAGVLICGALGYRARKPVPWPRETEVRAALADGHAGACDPRTCAPEAADAGRVVVPVVV